jgi:pyruvate kinase
MGILEHKLTDKVPPIRIQDTKYTKILATVGPVTSSTPVLQKMFAAGVDGFRLNFSHGTNQEKADQLKRIRQVSLKTGKPVTILQDLHGPKIALSKFESQPIALDKGTLWRLQYGAELDAAKHTLPLEFDLSSVAKTSEPLYIADGRIKAKIENVDPATKSIYIRVINGGIVTSGKGLNLPDTDFTGSVITEKDIEDVTFGSSLDFDYVALSFVQKPEDVLFFKNLLKSLGSNAKVIAKIETKSAIQNLEEIITVSDGAMVARGDMAVEVGAEKVPVLQRRITELCIKKKKLCIVATQMLASMVASPEPTRAEVSDVATAVIVGADCVMLSEETAIGSYPIEAISAMKQTILYTQNNNNIRVGFKSDSFTETEDLPTAIASAVIDLASLVSATAIVVETRTGFSAREIAANRPDRPIIAVTSEQKTAQQLAITYGIKSFIRPEDKLAATKLTNWLKRGGIFSAGDIIVTASGKYPGMAGATDTIKLRII